jgi:CBS domain-containing protein
MNVGNICQRQVYLVKPDEPLADAAREMQRRRIGALVVVRDLATPVRALGILTDRDIVCGQFLRQADLHTLTVGDVMTSDPLTLAESLGVSEAIAALRTRGVRRAPVVNEAGEVVGIATLDDLLPAVAAQLNALAKLIGTQSLHEGGR